MSASPEFVEYIRELFIPLGELADGKFFGGFAFKSCSKQFAIIMDNTLYFCVNDATRPKYKSARTRAFTYSTKVRVVQVRKYFSAPEYLLDDQNELVKWANEAIQAAHSYK